MVITKRLIKRKDQQNSDNFLGIYGVLLWRTVLLTITVTWSSYTQLSIFVAKINVAKHGLQGISAAKVDLNTISLVQKIANT